MLHPPPGPTHTPQNKLYTPYLYSRSDSAGAAGDDGSMMPYLDRIERLAYADKRRMDSSRSALAAHLHSSECTFKPTINPRSARMARVRMPMVGWVDV